MRGNGISMKITDIKTLILHYPYKQWIADGCGSCGARGAFRILIETDTELQGNKLYTPHSFFSAVMTAANIQFAASQVNIPFIEAEENENPLRTELLKEPIETDAHMNYLVSDRPGLGIALNWDIVEKYMVK